MKVVSIAASCCALIILSPFSTMTPPLELVALSRMIFRYCNEAVGNQSLFVDLYVATQFHVDKHKL